jgi:hypothetical protein
MAKPRIPERQSVTITHRKAFIASIVNGGRQIGYEDSEKATARRHDL